MYQEVVGVGNIIRTTENSTILPPGSLLPVTGSLSSLSLSSLSFAVSPSLPDLNDSVASYLSVGLAQLFGQSFTLGSPGMQSLSTGQAATDNIDFDYWLEDLVL